MWFVFLKILLCLYLTNNVNSYQYSVVNTKTPYVNDKWKNKYDNKNYIASSNTASSSHKTYHHTTMSPYNVKPSSVHFRHNKFRHLDGVLNRLDSMTTTTPSYKSNHKNDDYDFMADDNYDDQEYDDEVEDDDWVSEKEYFSFLIF